MLPRVLLLSLLALPAALAATYKDNGGSSDLETTTKLRTHSLYAPYVDQELNNRWWDFGADTIINTNKHVRLTQDRQSEMGWIWSRLPISVPSYQVEFEFKVDGKSNSLYGDGFAMWLTTTRAKEGPVFGSTDKFNGLGIFFDTYANSRHSYTFPRVSVMLGDGSTPYDHAKDGQANEVAGCSQRFRRTDIASRGRFTYYKNNYIKLELQLKKWGEWEECFTTNVTMPRHPYLGFSAVTGDVHDAHDIISVSTHELVPRAASSSRPRVSPTGSSSWRSRSRSGRSGSGFAAWLGWLVKWIVIVTVLLVVAGFGRAWWMQRRNKRF